MIKEYLDINYKVIHNTLVELPCNPRWTKDVVNELSEILSIDTDVIASKLKDWSIENGFDVNHWEYAYKQQRKTIYTQEEMIKFLDLKNNPFLKYFSKNNRFNFDMLMFFEASRKSAVELFKCEGYSGPIIYNIVDENEDVRKALVFLCQLKYYQEEDKKTNRFWEIWINTEEYYKTLD